MLLNSRAIKIIPGHSIFQINGQFERPTLLIVAPCGAIFDSVDQAGLAHLTEHVLVHMLKASALKLSIDKQFDFVAYTDYSHMVFQLSVENKPGFMQLLVESVMRVFAQNELSECMIRTSKEEVVHEIEARQEALQAVASALTKGSANTKMQSILGDMNSVSNIQSEAIKNYIEFIGERLELSLLYDPEVQGHLNLVQRETQEEIFFPKARNFDKCIHIKHESGQNFLELEIVEQINRNKAVKLYQMIHEALLVDTVCGACGECEVIFSQRSLGTEQYIRVIRATNLTTKEIAKILSHSKWEIAYSEETFVKHKEVLNHLLSALLIDVEINESLVIENMLSYLKYGDLILLNSEEVRALIAVLESLSYEAFKHYCERRYPNEMKVIKS